MVKWYKDIVTPPTGISKEDKPPPTEWVYVDAMHNLMGMKHIINPPLAVDTGAETTVIETERMCMHSLTPPSPACLLTTPETFDEAPIPPHPQGIVDMQPPPELSPLQSSK
ncbi:hypothetical protein PR048_001392 [Dryococelus australis]|uniref:Peptidase A2 domain-containing protein n=1 Tax=Dryococelus australis TaxID=614101 RepID=A0ABQ9IHB6_9NEOP|nr:hypothetical protein PR048_001392 [Dryococelus australis]